MTISKEIKEKKNKEKEKIRQEIIKLLAKDDPDVNSNACYAIQIANKNSMLNIIPSKYLVLFVKDVLNQNIDSQEINGDITFAHKISTLNGFKDEKVRKQIEEMSKLPKHKEPSFVVRFDGGS